MKTCPRLTPSQVEIFSQVLTHRGRYRKGDEISYDEYLKLPEEIRRAVDNTVENFSEAIVYALELDSAETRYFVIGRRKKEYTLTIYTELSEMVAEIILVSAYNRARENPLPRGFKEWHILLLGAILAALSAVMDSGTPIVFRLSLCLLGAFAFLAPFADALNERSRLRRALMRARFGDQSTLPWAGTLDIGKIHFFYNLLRS